MDNSLLDFLKQRNIKHLVNPDLKKISYVKIGTTSSLIIYPRSVQELVSVLKCVSRFGFPYKILGRTSNVLFTKNAGDYIFISTLLLTEAKINGNTAVIEAGVSIPRLALDCLNADLSGLEELSGIPGTIGGAFVTNAGAYGREISDLVSSVRVYDTEAGRIYDCSKSECSFGYRHSCFLNPRLVVLSAKLVFSQGDKNNIKSRMDSCKAKRIASQPTGALSLGSVFKRTRGNSAGYYIDCCGMKGLKVGGAQISEKHAGFIINTGDATADDYLSLMDRASVAVREKFSLDLVPEIVVI